MIGSPVALAVLALWHPLYSGHPDESIANAADRWLLVHLLQLPLIALLALSLILLVSGLPGRSASIARGAAVMFAALYSAFDAVAGIATGVLAREANRVTPGEASAIEAAIDTLFQDSLVGGDSSLLAVVASLAWLVTVLAAALALRNAGVHRVGLVLIALSALLFPLGHTPPNAQLALGCLAVGAAVAELAPRRARNPRRE